LNLNKVKVPVPTCYALDHVVLLAGDLAAASYELGLLGFTVVYGGEHAALGSHNALIPFEDGSYLELIAFRTPGAPPAPEGPAGRMARWKARGEGLVDLALVPRDIESAIRDAGKRGLQVLGPLPGGRARPDGERVEWRGGLPDGFDLPFLCADVTPRSLRVPEGLAREHPNGATGIRRVTVGVHDVDASLRRWRALLGDAGVSSEPNLRVGSTSIELERVEGPEGPCALEIATRKADRAVQLDPSRTRGAKIILAGP